MTPHPQYVAFYKYIENDAGQTSYLEPHRYAMIATCWAAENSVIKAAQNSAKPLLVAF